MEKVLFQGETNNNHIFCNGAFQKLMGRMPDAERTTYSNELNGYHINRGFVEYYHIPPGVTLRWVTTKDDKTLWTALATLHGDEFGIDVVYKRLITGIGKLQEAERSLEDAQKYLDALKI